ncbi:MAG: glycogen synthase GlgA [Candidatus Abyssubacteria bacterium]
MKVLFAASEASPFVKTGGLADVIGSLPQALKRSGAAEVFVVIPKYNCIDTFAHGIKQTGFRMPVPISGQTEWAELWECRREIPYFFVHNPRFFDRPHPYQENGWDYSDNAERFVFFSRAVLELCRGLDFWPDVIHCNDWHTALIPVFLHANDFTGFGKPVATVFTVHNAGYQGRFGLDKLWQTGLPPEMTASLEHAGEMNFLKAGVLHSDVITTVSRRYSEEIKRLPAGNGLEGVFQYRSADLFGILNGIDTREWNPAADPYLFRRYTISDLSGKRECKLHLQRQLGFQAREDVPLLAAVMRLTEQKGVHLMEPVVHALDHIDAQFVLVGSGHPTAERRACELAGLYGGKMAAIVGDHISYDPSVVHQVEAGADIFVMPSLYEPCGLNQMFSLRYGTVPVVRATGGLEDTVVEYDPSTGEGNGFKFHEPTSEALARALGRAIHFYVNRKDDWRRIVRNGMSADFSWEVSAANHLRVYEHALSRVGERAGAV